MGTNYYAVTNECACCNRNDTLHICKSMLSFQARTEWTDDGVVITLGSWAEWRDFLRSDAVRVVDEYEDVIEVEDFIRRVEATEPADRRRQFDWMRTHGYPTTTYPAEDADWIDADGFSFTCSEFS